MSEEDRFWQILNKARDGYDEVMLDLGGRTVSGRVEHLDDDFVTVRPQSSIGGMRYEAHTVRLSSVVAVSAR